ncbi:MAG: leucine-rich repeat domain-containing protein [Lachnospiraceae bacterium]|nr:leucine-rich repeat domain-containing protein [Lachnospiraceae bacterium]
MKKRLLSIVLSLCLCISSQSVAYAAQNVPSQPEQTRTGSETEETDSGSETEETIEKTKTDTDPSETPAQPEETEIESEPESETEETTEEPETGDGSDTARRISLQQDNVPRKRSVEKPDIPDIDSATLTPAKVYDAMIALRDKTGYTEGSEWTDYVPYSGKGDDVYRWNGGAIGGSNIVAVGCVAFAFTLSDAAFGRLPARMHANGAFKFEDIKVGDILRMNTDTHTVIVLKVSDTGVVVAEGNNNGKVHWGRTIDKDTVMRDTSHYITRYPEGYTPPTDPGANDIAAQGTLDGGLTWKLIKAGTLTISGNGAMPDFESIAEQPWSDNSDSIYKVVIENGVTGIGDCAFWKCGVLSAEISSSVQSIGNSAFRETDIMSVKIPSSVKTIGDSAFRGCQGLGSVTISNGVETIGQNAFLSCTSLASISLPASIVEVGAAAFCQCTKLTSVTFAPGSNRVSMGDSMFAECWYLMSVKLPQNIDRIGVEMFMNCKNLAGVEIPQGAESIGNKAFASCIHMSVVAIPDSVTAIESSAFSNCPLKDVYFTGDEAQWNNISKSSDVITVVSNATIHYNYDPSTDPDPGEGDDNNGGQNPGDSENNNGGQNPGDSENNNGGQNPGNSSNGSKPDQKNPSKNSADKDDSAEREQDVKAAVETWKPTTPDEIRRYACVGRETIRCSLPKENAYKIDIENAMQGPMCFKSFEAVLGEYTIGRTYNIYADSKTTYSTAEEVQLTIEIPSAIYRKDREYKMICVTKGGLPVVYEDQDSDPKTITIETDKFHAYALVYK